ERVSLGPQRLVGGYGQVKALAEAGGVDAEQPPVGGEGRGAGRARQQPAGGLEGGGGAGGRGGPGRPGPRGGRHRPPPAAPARRGWTGRTPASRSRRTRRRPTPAPERRRYRPR